MIAEHVRTFISHSQRLAVTIRAVSVANGHQIVADVVRERSPVLLLL